MFCTTLARPHQHDMKIMYFLVSGTEQIIKVIKVIVLSVFRSEEHSLKALASLYAPGKVLVLPKSVPVLSLQSKATFHL